MGFDYFCNDCYCLTVLLYFLKRLLFFRLTPLVLQINFGM